MANGSILLLFASAFSLSFVLSLLGFPAPFPFLLGEVLLEELGVDPRERVGVPGAEGRGVRTSMRSSSSERVRWEREGGVERAAAAWRFRAEWRRSWAWDPEPIFGWRRAVLMRGRG